MSEQSFIEIQLPVSKLSKESYKERKANTGQTLTGLGKWWGRKPLVMVRATLLGLLMPVSDDPRKDREIFLKLMTMDDEGLWLRKNKSIPVTVIYQLCTDTERSQFFETRKSKFCWKRGIDPLAKESIIRRVFFRMGYDERLEYCARPEEIVGPSLQAWDEINAHLGTSASTLQELVGELGVNRFGHTPRVGDAFCGGGNIPFEVSRLGCEAYGSDLNPVAALLTWADINIIGGGQEVIKQVRTAQRIVYDAVCQQIDDWEIERNEDGWIAEYYLYCCEVIDPMTGWRVPLAPHWVIGEKTHTIARLVPDIENRRFDIKIIQGASNEEMQQAKLEGTWVNGLRCPVDREGNHLPPHLRTVVNAEQLRGRGGLRQWDANDILPRPSDVFQERLFCIRYLELPDEERGETKKHYVSPTEEDFARENKVLELLLERFPQWLVDGYLPNKRIDPGEKTDEPIRTRGWTYWHQLFNPRQLLINGYFMEISNKLIHKQSLRVAVLLSCGRLANWNSKLSRWHPHSANEKGEDTFSNQALNTLLLYSTRSFQSLDTSWYMDLPISPLCQNVKVTVSDARVVDWHADIWLTDPPYADAVCYEEITEFFLTWYEKQISILFPDWYADSKRALAIKGVDQGFRLAMVDCYKRLTELMPDNGLQVVMFTHQNADVWADLALILWAAGLQVMSAWTIGTETTGGIRTGNLVQGTVLLVLRKRKGDVFGSMADVYPDVQKEVQQQIKTMLELDDKEEPNFTDADYQLAAYAAALRILTGYQSIDDIDVMRQLRRPRGQQSPLTPLIERAVKIASDFLIPDGLDRMIWRGSTPEERFYLKGVEVESHGEYREGVYQEFARGFGVRDYRSLLGSGVANQTRLKTPSELRGRDLQGEGGFSGSLLRYVLFAIYKTAEEEDPRIGREWLKQELSGYWEHRQTIIAQLRYLWNKPSVTMTHWKQDTDAAHLLLGAVENDGV